MPDPTEINEEPEIAESKRLVAALMCMFIPPFLSYPFELWTYYSMRGDKSETGESYASAIFKVFGFPQPDKIDLLRHSDLSMGADGGWYAAWRGDKLLKKFGA